MKRLFLFLFVLIPVITSAQIQFGYLSYQQMIKEMPEYTQAMQELQTLKDKYNEEATRGEAEFQKKFVDFLQGQKDFPQTIMQKRQAELQALMDNGVAFRLQVQTLLAQAEKDLLAGVQKKLNRVLLEVGVEYGYGFILNTDDNACPYINPVVGVDVTEIVRQKLKVEESSQDEQNE
jgi:outer membrane protein